MHTSLVLTVIGPDRPGLVEQLAQTVAAHDANWLESRMANLAGQFAGLLRVSVPEARRDALRGALDALEAAGLRVLVAAQPAAEDPASESSRRPPLRLELVGQDRPGIVREISRALAARGVNFEELETRTSSAPMSGETLFHARAELRLPVGVSPEALRETLEHIGQEWMVDVTLDEPGGDS